MIFISSHSINWSRWRPRNDNRSWFFAGKMKRWDTQSHTGITTTSACVSPKLGKWTLSFMTCVRWQLSGGRWGPCPGRWAGRWAYLNLSRNRHIEPPQRGCTPMEWPHLMEPGMESECVLRWLSHSCVLTILKEPCLVPQEFPSEDGKCLPQQDSQGQVAVAGETCQWHHHAEDDHLEHGVGYEQTAEGTRTMSQDSKWRWGKLSKKRKNCVFLVLNKWKITFSCENFLV